MKYDFETVVVIATSGSEDLLRKSLPKMGKWPVVVVESGALSPGVARVCAEFDNVAHLSTPYYGYDTGSYLWAYWNVSAENYLFLQDSCCPRDEDFVEQFAAAMPGETGVVAWASFSMNIWDNEWQRLATEWMYGTRAQWPSKGIFGPIFYTNRKTLDHMANGRLLPMPPVHKEQQQAMERAWAILFHRAGARVTALVDEFEPRREDMGNGVYPALTKTFWMRA